ncbi:hypothetical protein E7T06_00395 [Deinococcus sp. Arct2-2]|uniref:hypothetical protein n=1 Tax=Deinococcus sp. Arct2-2 TaxID=2568653 RepID=UPI0010A3FA3A|nr:hypothetical protein [Deinococcus sp. Arct2-2]THF71869.1 hypothetical protein E7T06_00395 [Deinococcus sp. Arct2-2]
MKQRPIKQLALLLMPALLSGCAVFGGLRGPTPAPKAEPIAAPILAPIASPSVQPVAAPMPPAVSASVELPPVQPTAQPSPTPPKPQINIPAPPANLGLIAVASASADVKGVTVILGIRNKSTRPVTFRYTPQVNWGSCELPPLVALMRSDGRSVTAPSTGGRIGCTEILLTRTLAPGDTLTLKRILPPLTLGSYRLTAWLDAESAGMPLRVQAESVALVVR